MRVDLVARRSATHGARQRALALEVVGVDDAHQPEVEEADAAVVEQQVVAGVRVAARRGAGALQRAEEEAEDDLAEAVALGVVERLDLPRSARPSSSSVTSTRRLESPVSTGGHVDERVAAPGARHRAVVLRLDLVVELLGDALAQLAVERLDVEPGREPLDQRQQQREVAQVGLDRLGDAGVLDLDRDLVAVERDRAVDLADRGGGERLLLEVGEGVADRPPSSSSSSFSTFLNGSGGTSSRSAASVALNSSRSDSGIAVKSTVERTWPTFIAAPRIWPSCLTSSRASAAARSPVAASASSGERRRLAARVPAQRAAWPATRPPKRAVRAMRLRGGESAI